MEIAVNHDNRGGIIIQITDNDRHGFLFRQLAGPVAAVSSNQFIAALRTGPCNRRDKYTVLTDAFRCFQHRFIVLYFKGMPFKGVQFCQRNLHNLFAPHIGPAFFGGKQIIDRGQLYFFRAASQPLAPPSSNFCRHLPPCHPGHGRKYFSPPH